MSADGSITKEDPVSLEPQRLFRASQHDNEMYDDDDPHSNTQALDTIIRWVFSTVSLSVTHEHSAMACGAQPSVLGDHI